MAGPPEDGASVEGSLPPIPADEERLLRRVHESLSERAGPQTQAEKRYDQELIAMRDEIGEARREDVPALIAQMERLEGVAFRRAEARGLLVDPRSPYFGHLRLREQVADGRTVERDVMVGRATYVDPARRVNVVDWRNAPVSQLYYRYAEGSDYEERFGEREVEGEILARRTVTIEDGHLARVSAPQGVWVKRGHDWAHLHPPEPELAGGEGTAARPARGVLGASAPRGQRLDRHLPEIAALIDPRQFELITAPSSGVVVIQGGAGSGKTTIGLHRIAYLAFAAPERFAAKKMLVVTYGAALAAYIGQVLPSLGVHGVQVVTFQAWAERELRRGLTGLEVRVVDDAPPAVVRVKSHPALLRELEARAKAMRGQKGSRTVRAVIELWAELLTDRPRLEALLAHDPEGPVPVAQIEEAHRLMVERVAAVTDRDPREAKTRKPSPTRKRKRAADEEVSDAVAEGIELPRGRARLSSESDADDENVRGETGIDGLRTAGEEPQLDLEDVAMLLRAQQILRGPSGKLAHLFVDEAQDLSPLELSVLMGETGDARSVTLAGDTAQRLFLDNGFGDWRTVLRDLGLAHVAIEPLRISYRSTRQILSLARHAMGARTDIEPAEAPRSGAPVEAHRFPGMGAAVGFLAEALRPLFHREPRATVAILARHAEQADRYYEGLKRAEIPSLRRVRDQDFAFRPGIEVTEIRQVKGLEYDYVIIVEANANSFSTDEESRHLFHIAATRAAYQLWLVVTAAPSPLIPAGLLEP